MLSTHLHTHLHTLHQRWSRWNTKYLPIPSQHHSWAVLSISPPSLSWSFILSHVQRCSAHNSCNIIMSSVSSYIVSNGLGATNKLLMWSCLELWETPEICSCARKGGIVSVEGEMDVLRPVCIRAVSWTDILTGQQKCICLKKSRTAWSVLP